MHLGASLTARSRKNHAADAIHEPNFMEVDEKPERHIEQLHVAEELGLVDRKDLSHGFRFNKQTACDEHVKSKGLLASEPFVLNTDDSLAGRIDPTQFQLTQQTPLIDRLEQAWSFISMHLDCGSNDMLRQRTRLSEQRMHGGLMDEDERRDNEFFRTGGNRDGRGFWRYRARICPVRSHWPKKTLLTPRPPVHLPL
jgi:hypothetical protein